jgi:hypothetical protein
VNVYYWVFCGFLQKLPILQATAIKELQARNALMPQAGRVAVRAHALHKRMPIVADPSVAS